MGRTKSQKTPYFSIYGLFGFGVFTDREKAYLAAKRLNEEGGMKEFSNYYDAAVNSIERFSCLRMGAGLQIIETKNTWPALDKIVFHRGNMYRLIDKKT